MRGRPPKDNTKDHCTECGISLEDLFSGEFYYDYEEVKFCPNLGAKMEGERKWRLAM